MLSDKDNVKLINSCVKDTWCVGVPVQITEYSLYYSYPYNRNFIKAHLVNVSDKVIKSLYLDIDCYDDANDLIGRVQSLPISNVMAPSGAEFGEDSELIIEYLNASRVEITVSKVVFADSEVWRKEIGNEGETVQIAAQQAVNTSEFYPQILRECEGIVKPLFLPLFGEKIWQCTCGAVNENALSTCRLCGADKNWIKIHFDAAYLSKQSELYEKSLLSRDLEEKYEGARVKEKTYDGYLSAAKNMEALGNYKDAKSLAASYRSEAEKIKNESEKQRKEEIYRQYLISGKVSPENYRKSAEELEKIAPYKDASRLAEEYRAKALSIERNERRQAKQQETLKKKEEKLKREKRKKITKISLIIFSSVLALALVVSAALFWIIPAMSKTDNDDLYNEAAECVSEGRFTDAIKIYKKLGTYREADKKIEIISEALTGFTDAVFLSSSEYPCYSITEEGVLSFDRSSYSVKSGIVDIPDVFDDIPVLRLSDSFLINCDWLVKVVIPRNVTAIGFQSFKDCTSLTEVVLHDGIVSIGQSAFEGCTALKSVTVPKYVNFLGAYAFYKCSSLESIILPSRITEIREYTFGRCEALTSVTFEGNVTSVGNYTFSFCTSLESIDLPDTVKEIGGYAFSQCTKLNSFTVGDSVKSIGRYAFSDCTALTQVKLGKAVESVENNAFMGCSSLAEIEINESIKNIKYKVFDGCKSLAKVLYKGSRETWESSVSVGSGNTLMTDKLEFEK